MLLLYSIKILYHIHNVCHGDGTVQLPIDLAVMDAKQASAIAVKARIFIVVDILSLE